MKHSDRGQTPSYRTSKSSRKILRCRFYETKKISKTWCKLQSRFQQLQGTRWHQDVSKSPNIEQKWSTTCHAFVLHHAARAVSHRESPRSSRPAVKEIAEARRLDVGAGRSTERVNCAHSLIRRTISSHSVFESTETITSPRTKGWR